MSTKKLDKTGLSQVWAKITSLVSGKADKSTNLSGYGITDAYTKTEVDTKVSEKVDKATTIAGYGITDAYTKTEVYSKSEADTAIGDAVKTAVTGLYKVKGSIAFASLPTSDMASGDVYNITDKFTTTDAFVEGAGKEYPAGTNVAYVGDLEKWDCLAGTYDFSDFLTSDDLVDITEDEIDEICTMPS
jgi:phage-related tail fiber protein